ncbi:hypothetical protein [Spongiactinospora rosea]|uniref:hypothetical protein n=1 Tax=Spongiactinospora rosea TaxID=2248750 RepID=UPI0011C04946|nr:hypothetical protein [Spongiactinospora rosea]
MPTTADLNTLVESLRIEPVGSTVLYPGQNLQVKLAPDPATLSVSDLSGAIPVEVPVKLKEITWQIFLDAASASELIIDKDYAAPFGVNAPHPTFAFDPDLFSPSLDDPPPSPKSPAIGAVVKLSTLPGVLPNVIESDKVRLPVRLPIQVMPLPFPAVLALFLHTNFDRGAVLLVVPGDSRIVTVEKLTDSLEELRSTLSALNSIGLTKFSGILGPVQTVLTKIESQPHIHIRVTNQIRNLNHITLIDKFWDLFGWRSIEADDELSSLALLGASQKVELFELKGWATEVSIPWFVPFTVRGGEFTLETNADKPYSLVRDLRSKNPASDPSDTLKVTAPPSGDFNDSLSSLRFVPTGPLS